MSASLPTDCPFCLMAEARIVFSNHLAFAVEDAFPVSPGHMLVIPRRHVTDFFDLTLEELEAVYGLLHAARQRMNTTLRPDGLSVGVNVGGAAGQTIPHAHIHLIPRFIGDVADPAGGVRNVIPGKGRYA
jgi:diadenosine tetraphosphate (Ap4A) HIT family hydrolase